MSDINLEDILNQKEFDQLSKDTKKGLVKLSQDLVGKSSNDAMKLIGNFYNTNLKNQKLSNTDKKALYTAITSGLDNNTKKQFDSLYSMVMGGMKK